MLDKSPNRWIIAAAAIAIQICCGSLYSWSVFVKPLTASEPFTLVQISATFQIALAFVGVGAMVGGLWQDRVGPRLVTSIGGIGYGCGFLLASFAAEHQSLAGLYLGYGLITGLSIGMAYICPVATIVKWFPDHRGLMIGATVMGYGAGAMLMSPIAARLIIHAGVPATFAVFAVAYLVIVVGGAQFQVNPAHGWCPPGWEPRSAVSKMASKIDYTVKQAIRSWRFWLLWLLLVINTSAGIMIISQASPLAQQQVQMTVIAASSMVAILSVFNALGRIWWAWISDRLGRAQVYFVLFAIQTGVFFALPHLHHKVPFEIAVFAIALCYGGGFSVLPILAADFFGSRYMGGIYGWITMVTWIVAAIPSPLLIAHVREATGTYDLAITVIGFVLLLALPLPLLAARAARRTALQEVAPRVEANSAS